MIVDRLMRMVVGILLLGGLVHIATILLIPEFARPSGHRELSGDVDGVPTVVNQTSRVIADLDPAFVHAFCPVVAAPGLQTLQGPLPAWIGFISVLDAGGRSLGSIATADLDGERLNLVIGLAEDVDSFVPAPSARVDTTAPTPLVIEKPGDLIVIKFFAPAEAVRKDALDAISHLRCGFSSRS